MGRGAWALLLLAVAACGSWSTQFRPSDPGFVARALDHDPDVFVDRLPPRRYRAVGMIEVHAPSGQTMDEFLERAIPEGRARGCELIVARHLHVALERPVLVAQTTPRGANLGPNPASETIGGQEPLRRRRDFVCGVYDRA